MDYEEFVKEYLNMDNQSNGVTYIKLPMDQTSEWYETIYGFIKEYKGDVRVSSKGTMVVGTATKEEFLRSEEIIQSIVDQINPEWTIKQKAAYVHYKMGEIISYIPDQAFSCKSGAVTEVARNVRNLWKSIDNGQGVCNSINTIYRNILSRIGIKTQELSSTTHTFTMIETEEGNILSDTIWDLTNTLFEARPMYFGKTYEELQKIDGPLSKAHRLEEVPDGVIGISEEELREIYYSIGLTTEDRKFKMPILKKIDEIDEKQYDSDREKVDDLFKMFTSNFSKQAMHLSETRTMLENCMITLGIDGKSITTKFVYSKEDAECEKPYLCIHLNGEETNGTIAVLNTAEMKFENLSLQNFDGLYKQHNEDTRAPFWKKYLQREEVTRNTEQEKSEK